MRVDPARDGQDRPAPSAVRFGRGSDCIDEFALARHRRGAELRQSSRFVSKQVQRGRRAGLKRACIAVSGAKVGTKSLGGVLRTTYRPGTPVPNIFFGPSSMRSRQNERISMGGSRAVRLWGSQVGAIAKRRRRVGLNAPRSISSPKVRLDRCSAWARRLLPDDERAVLVRPTQTETRARLR